MSKILFIQSYLSKDFSVSEYASEKFIKEYGRRPSESELYAQLIKNTIDLKIDRRIQGNGMLYLE